MVSVIIPVYNVEKYLKQCIDSVLQQTYTDIQVILVDDGSSDGCGKICDTYRLADPRVEVIHKQNGGLGYARNSGLALAKGEYVIFIDSDDWIEADHIERLVCAAEAAGADAVIHGFKKCSDQGKIYAKPTLVKLGDYTNVLEEILYPMIAADGRVKLDKTLPVAAWCKMYRTDVIKKNDLQFVSERECISEDIMFDLVFFPKCKKVSIIDEYGYNYRFNPNSISNSYNPKRTERMQELFRRMMQWREEIGLADDAEVLLRLYRCYIMKCRIGIELIAHSNLSIAEKKKEAKKILDHPYTLEALQQYPIRNYSAKLAVMMLLMRMRMTNILLLMYQHK